MDGGPGDPGGSAAVTAAARQASVAILPDEILYAILNGRDGANGRSILDPRFRFVARAVCLRWHRIVGSPTRADASRLAEVRPAGARLAAWVAGRVVCASAIVRHFAGAADRSTDIVLVDRVADAYAPASTGQARVVTALAGSPDEALFDRLTPRTLADGDDDGKGFLIDEVPCGSIEPCPSLGDARGPDDREDAGDRHRIGARRGACCERTRRSVCFGVAAVSARIDRPDRVARAWAPLDAPMLLDCALLAVQRDAADAVGALVRRIARLGREAERSLAFPSSSSSPTPTRPCPPAHVAAAALWESVGEWGAARTAARLLDAMRTARSESAPPASSCLSELAGGGGDDDDDDDDDAGGDEAWEAMQEALRAAWRSEVWLEAAARAGSVGVFAAHGRAHPYDHPTAMRAAARHGQVALCRWLAAERRSCCGFGRNAMCEVACHAAAGGSRAAGDVLAWLARDEGFKPTAGEAGLLLRRVDVPGRPSGRPSLLLDRWPHLAAGVGIEERAVPLVWTVLLGGDAREALRLMRALAPRRPSPDAGLWHYASGLIVDMAGGDSPVAALVCVLAALAAAHRARYVDASAVGRHLGGMAHLRANLVGIGMALDRVGDPPEAPALCGPSPAPGPAPNTAKKEEEEEGPTADVALWRAWCGTPRPLPAAAVDAIQATAWRRCERPDTAALADLVVRFLCDTDLAQAASRKTTPL